MQRDVIWIAVLALLITGGILWPEADAATNATRPGVSAMYTRDCFFPAGGWTTVDCSAAAAYSAQLTANTRYVLQATGDAYFAPGITDTGVDADSNDGYIPAGSWLIWATGPTVRYFSCEASGSGGVVRYIECQ
jgi:hypothetical protein